MNATVAARLPDFYMPMLLRAQKQVFQKPDWLYEPKLDGMRCIAICDGAATRIYSRQGRDISATFPNLCRSLSLQKKGMVLDGEIVAFDTTGKVSFENLQERWLITDPQKASDQDKTNPVAYYAFDIIQANQIDCTRTPLIDRKQLLFNHLIESHQLKSIHHFDDAQTLFDATRDGGLEGIVAKHKTSINVRLQSLAARL